MSEHIGFRCPDDLVTLVNQHKEATGKGKTEIIIDMLRFSLPSLLISDRLKLPEDSVIYFVWTVERLLYIGKTARLKQRINSHHRLVQFLSAGDDVRVSWFCASKENLEAYETSLIESLDPELNGLDIPNEFSQGSKVVSFRLSDKEIELLQAFQISNDDGSLNQTAVRLLRGILKGESTTLTEAPLLTESSDIEAVVEKRVNAVLETSVMQKLEAIEQRLVKLNA